MKEGPILFKGDMVKAILEGRKTQTRRVIKPQPTSRDGYDIRWHGGMWTKESGFISQAIVECPYGQVGDKLWMRETWAVGSANWEGKYSPADENERLQVSYRAGVSDTSGCKGMTHDLEWKDVSALRWAFYYNKRHKTWKPSIHMPRWASRITLEITGVNVERVQDIDAYGALQEGIDLPVPTNCDAPEPPPEYEGWSEARREEWIEGMARAVYFCRCADADDHIQTFHTLWDSINAKRGYSWDSNPWLWALTFKAV